MGSRRQFAFSSLALLFSCLPCVLQAESVYKIQLSAAAPPSKLELYVTYSGTDAERNGIAPYEFKVPVGGLYTAPAISAGGWEVTVAFDPAHCGIYCAYRRKRDSAGRAFLADLLPPPITAIHIYTGSAEKPETVIVDPASLSLPGAASNPVITAETPGIPGRKLLFPSLSQAGGTLPPAPQRVHLSALSQQTLTALPHAISLRI